jgi:hypothetical protein
MTSNATLETAPIFCVTNAQGLKRGLVLTRLTASLQVGEGSRLTAGLLPSDLYAVQLAVEATAGDGVFSLIAFDAPAITIVEQARRAMARTFATDGAVLLVRAQSEQTARAFLASVQADYATEALIR